MNDFGDLDPVVCITHCDMDGYLAGYFVKKKYPNARIHVSNYGKDLPNHLFVQGAKLFVTDFSLTPFEFEKAQRCGMQVIWIDHHKANIEKLQSQGVSCEGLRRTDRSGAYLTFEYLNPNQAVPDFVKLVDDYDRWVFADPRTMGFFEGMRLMEMRPSFKGCYIWDMLAGDTDGKLLNNIISMGNRIHEYLTAKNKVLCDELTYMTQFSGANVLVANTKQSNSTFFDTADKSKANAVCLIQFSPDIAKYIGSFYSPDNIQETIHLAESLGGGGHPKAAGFRTVQYPFAAPVYSGAPTNVKEKIDKLSAVHNMISDPAVLQAATKAARACVMVSTWNSRWRGGKSCIHLNHPYLTELIGSIPHVKDLVQPDTGEIVDAVCSYVMTNNGLYRYGLWYVDQRNGHGTNRDQILSGFGDCIVGNDVYGEQTPYGIVWHWYSKEMISPLPVPKF